MASITPSTSCGGETKELPDSNIHEAASGDEEKTIDGEDTLAKESWNNPSVNKYRLCSCFVLFLAGGLFFTSYGVLIPEFEKDYGKSHASVSLIFIGDIVSSAVAATVTNVTHLSLGRRGAGVIGALCLGLGNIFLALHPPWPAVPVMICLVVYGIATLDSAASAWMGSLHHASGFLGLLQGCFGIGSTIAPSIADAMIQRGIPYYRFYYLPFALSMLGGIGFMISFWDENGEKYTRDISRSHKPEESHAKEILKNKVSWILATFVLFGWGAESTISSWIVIYLTEGRGGSLPKASLVNSMFWFSFTLGRFFLIWVLGAIPPKWGEKGPASLVICLSITLELMFWLLPTFVGSSVAGCFLGFFYGPLYPLILSVLTKLLPRHLHVSAIGIGSAFGAVGSSCFPIVAGAIAQYKGIAMIHPLLLGLFTAQLALWHCLPAPPSGIVAGEQVWPERERK